MATHNNNNCSNNKQYCILFYKYHPLTDNPTILETYRYATETLCKSLHLTGRILIGLSNNGEGINGTLAGTKDDLNAYVDCMLGRDVVMDNIGSNNTATNLNDDNRRRDAVTAFRKESEQFFAKLNVPQLFLDSPNDFKWSSWSGGEGSELSGVCPGGKRSTAISNSPDSTNNCGNNNSATKESENWFPDLNIKIVKEIISTGGAFSNITTKDTSVGYLTPKEWHKEIQRLVEKKKNRDNNAKGGGTPQDEDEEIETVLIDVRNHKECQIGSFAPGIAIDPQTKTFAQFPKWVKDNSTTSSSKETSTSTTESGSSSLLNNKRILMYCTGGIRCEKASAYIRQVVPQNKEIYHVKGGIHKYLEEFGNAYGNEESKKESSSDGECLFVGKNFVFDRRGALDAKGHGVDDFKTENSCSTHNNHLDDGIIGKCQYCSDPHDMFHPENVCTVCREPILICDKCQSDLSHEQQQLRGLATTENDDGMEDDSAANRNIRAEYHCESHFHLKTCYFTSLHGFPVAELQKQLEQLQLYNRELEGIGKKGKQKRRTLRKQIEKIEAFMNSTLDGGDIDHALQCRHCGSSACTSNCWGFHGGKTRMLNQVGVNNQQSDAEGNDADNQVEIKKNKQRNRVPSNQRPAKRAKRQNDLSEIETLQLCNPPSHHRNESNGMRVPPPVVLVKRSGVKGKWCGKTVKWVLNNEFGESLNGLNQDEKDDRLEQLIKEGLIRINGLPIESSNVLLRNMDTIERIIHWHEPPILVPAKISLTKHTLPESILPSNEDESTGRPLIYCINKPSSVPIYPSGPYYANSLMLMVEAQEVLPPKTLIPLHRIDRATSGVILCANMSSVARAIQGRMSSNSKDDEKNPPVRKLYLARVKGKFPESSYESPSISKDYTSIASIGWCGDDENIIEVNAPIAVDLEPGSTNKDDTSSNAMMHRSVRSDGKHSISRFKLIAYDAATNQSLVSCAPITGRGHQLRVHLQLVGFPIHNDVEYGGVVNSESIEEQKKLSAQAMLDITTSTSSECLHEDSISAQEVESATKLCKCCSGGIDGIKSSFTSAQLLGCGHAIDLHAYKYSVSFKQKEGSSNDNEEMTTSIEMSTDFPSWASSFAVDIDTLSWLN